MDRETLEPQLLSVLCHVVSYQQDDNLLWPIVMLIVIDRWITPLCRPDIKCRKKKKEEPKPQISLFSPSYFDDYNI